MLIEEYEDNRKKKRKKLFKIIPGWSHGKNRETISKKYLEFLVENELCAGFSISSIETVIQVSKAHETATSELFWGLKVAQSATAASFNWIYM